MKNKGRAKIVKIVTARGAPKSKPINAPRSAPPGEMRHASENDKIYNSFLVIFQFFHGLIINRILQKCNIYFEKIRVLGIAF